MKLKLLLIAIEYKSDQRESRYEHVPNGIFLMQEGLRL